MRSYDEAEVCELIGLFKLSLTGSKFFPHSIKLYRDNRLTVFKNTNGLQYEKIKKTFQKMFDNKGLDSTLKNKLRI